MNILALDLGTKCGFACSCGASGVWCLKPKATESIGQRYLRFKEHLEAHAMFCDFGHIFYEEVHAHMAVDAAHVFGGLQAILQTYCLEHKVEYRGIGVKTIKKYATGNGNADKKKMISMAIIKFKSINVIDDNHADALWLLDLATNQAGLTKS